MSGLPHAVIFCATSRDGFIAKKDGSIDWLNEANKLMPPDAGDCGFSAMMASVDALLMGRKTFEQVVGFGKDMYPYGATPLFIVTSQEDLAIPGYLEETVKHLKIVNNGSEGSSNRLIPPTVALAELKRIDPKINRVYIDGGFTAQQFLDAGLIVECVITEVPVTLGEGIPLFTTQEQRDRLEEQEELRINWDCGFIQKRYVRK